MKVLIYMVLMCCRLVICETTTSRKQDLLDQVQACYRVATKELGCVNTNTLPYSPHSRNAFAVEMDNVLHPCQIRKLFNLTDCVITAEPDRTYDRNFKSKTGKSVPGNRVAYLSRYLEVIDPDIYTSLMNAASHMVQFKGWVPADLSSLGVRTVEFITYTAGAALVKHADTGSMYTMTVMLRNDFTGGEFHVKNSDGEYVDYNAAVGTAVMFVSETTHYVSEVTSGTRNVLAVEFWKKAGLRFSDYRIHVNSSRTRLTSTRGRQSGELLIMIH